MAGIIESAIRRLLPLAQRIAPHLVEKLKVNAAVGREKMHRPHPFSLWSGMEGDKPPEGYTAPTAKPLPSTAPSLQQSMGHALAPFSPSGFVSWPGLSDRRYTGRHLPPSDERVVAGLPSMEEVVGTLHLRRPGEFTPCPRTSTLFCFFAQWFTDSFLRTDPKDRRRNTSNHEIDFCQLYGLDERTALALREGSGGRMRLENGLLPRLTDSMGSVLPVFRDASYIRDDEPDSSNFPLGQRLRDALGRSLPAAAGSDRWTKMYATGLERGNSTILYTALSTMCAREHNRVANKLSRLRPSWDDDRLFETARIVMIRNILQIVVEGLHQPSRGRLRLQARPPLRRAPGMVSQQPDLA